MRNTQEHMTVSNLVLNTVIDQSYLFTCRQLIVPVVDYACEQLLLHFTMSKLTVIATTHE